jgi:hypothetical protein
VRALCGDGALHPQDSEGENDSERGEDKEAIEVGERGGLLLPQMCESLQRHSPGSNRIAGEFQKTGLGLVKKGQRASPYLSTVFGPDEPMSFGNADRILLPFIIDRQVCHRPRPWFRDRNND